MSFLFDADTAEIKRIGSALRVPQEFRDPRSLGLNIGGLNALNVGFDGGGKANIGLRETPGFQSAINPVIGANASSFDRFGTLTSRLAGNESPFIQARVRPFEEAGAQRVAAAERDVGRRNISGSLGNTLISNEQRLATRDIADAGAQATQDSLTAQLAAEAGRLGVGEEGLRIADAQLKNELQQIFAGLEGLKISLGDQAQTSAQLTGSTAGVAGTGGDDLGGILDILRDLKIIP